jgi:hypothetical protein
LLLKNLQEKRLDFTLADGNGEALVKGQYNIYYQHEEYWKIRAAWSTFNPVTADAKELLEQRKRARQMIAFRLAVWDLESAPGVPIPLTIEALEEFGVPDDLLNNIIECIEEDRNPKATSDSKSGSG